MQTPEGMPHPMQRSVAEPTAAGVQALGRAVWDAGWRRVAVVGASKNAGKTTTLNALTAAAAQRRERVGLLSIGLDGEAFDAWLDIAKPRVAVAKGALVITAASAAIDAGNQLKVLRELDFGSALGPAVLAEAREPGGVLLCGVPHRAHVVAAVRHLQAAGAQRVLIDGAYHRQAAAHADVADAVVLAVGAVLGDTADEAAALAASSIQALATPGWRGDRRPDNALGEQGFLFCQGALTGHFLRQHDLTHVHTLVVAGPSQVLGDARMFAELARRGIAIVAQRPVPLCAATTNPFRPGGTDPAPDALLEAVAKVLTRLRLSVPVVDVVHGACLEAR